MRIHIKTLSVKIFEQNRVTCRIQDKQLVITSVESYQSIGSLVNRKEDDLDLLRQQIAKHQGNPDILNYNAQHAIHEKFISKYNF